MLLRSCFLVMITCTFASAMDKTIFDYNSQDSLVSILDGIWTGDPVAPQSPFELCEFGETKASTNAIESVEDFLQPVVETTNKKRKRDENKVNCRPKKKKKSNLEVVPERKITLYASKTPVLDALIYACFIAESGIKCCDSEIRYDTSGIGHKVRIITMEDLDKGLRTVAKYNQRTNAAPTRDARIKALRVWFDFERKCGPARLTLKSDRHKKFEKRLDYIVSEYLSSE